MPLFYIARHGETVFNAAERVQGAAPHTPLTRSGFAQADEMGLALRTLLGPKPDLILWSSPTGRALQTLAIVAEHLELDWNEARVDARLDEMSMGQWGGRFYRDIERDHGPFIDRAAGLFRARPPGGEWYEGIAERLRSWLDDIAGDDGDRLIVTHGISSRVLRGVLTGAPDRPECGAPVADALPQGSIVRIEGGLETVVHRGGGGLGASGQSAPA